MNVARIQMSSTHLVHNSHIRNRNKQTTILRIFPSSKNLQLSFFLYWLYTLAVYSVTSHNYQSEMKHTWHILTFAGWNLDLNHVIMLASAITNIASCKHRVLWYFPQVETAHEYGADKFRVICARIAP